MQRGQGFVNSQRGQGIGNLLGSLFKSIIPVTSRIARSIMGSPITKSVLKGARDAAIEGGLNVATDALRGQNIGDSVQQNLEGARQTVANAVDRGRLKRKAPTRASYKAKKKARGRSSRGRRKARDLFSGSDTE